MTVRSLSSLLLLASPAFAAEGLSGWSGVAGAQVQTKAFFAGGVLNWGNWTGSDASTAYSQSQLDQESFTGVLYEINLNQTIDVNKDPVHDYLIKSSQSMNTAGYPGYAWGAMFHTAYTWFTFGGSATQSVTHPEISTITRGEEFGQGVGPFSEKVQPNQPRSSVVSDYITDGAYVSSPDQGLGWWFGGLTSSNLSEPIEYSPSSDARSATITSRIFIEANMPLDGSDSISFTYLNVPTWLAGRTESSLVWLPYGEKGMLVMIGGINRPALILTEETNSTNLNSYMTELAIYDVAGAQWYNQSTLEQTPRPPITADFCTAVVPTEDGNGHEIFVYGGYDGTYTNAYPYDDVWVLSVPAFQWTLLHDGSKTPDHARQGSVCFAPNPTTLMTVGGTQALGGFLTTPNGVDMFDLSNATWTGTYDPSSNATLQLPEKVVSQLSSVGYTASGPGANAQIQGVNSGVSSLLAVPYPQRVSTYYPYTTSTSPTPTPTGTGTPTPGKKSNAGLIGGVVGGVVGGLLIIGLIAFCCLRRHRKNKEGTERTQTSRRNVSSWLGKSSTTVDPAPDNSNTSDDTAVNSTAYTHDKQPMSEIYEAPGSGPTTPGWGTYASGQRSPQVLSGSMATSPFMTPSAEVDAQSRHEIMDHVPRDGQSLRQHHMHPRSFSGDQVMSVRSDSISHASTNMMPSRHYGYISPYELPQDRSREDLARPTDMNLDTPRADADPNASTHSLGLGAEHVHSPVALMPEQPVRRKEAEKPRHQRNQSSMSSDIPNLPSPGPEEDRRRSRLLDTLPDPKSAASSPIQPQTAKRSVYKEDLDS